VSSTEASRLLLAVGYIDIAMGPVVLLTANCLPYGKLPVSCSDTSRLYKDSCPGVVISTDAMACMHEYGLVHGFVAD
jgi:hypothetical protein